jgi:hypothetical protein
MFIERLPISAKRIIGAGALVLAVGACEGAQPILSASADNKSFVPIPTQTVTLEPTLASTTEPTLEPTPSLSPTPESQTPILTDASNHFWMPSLGINASVGALDCGGAMGGSLPNAKDIFSSACSGGSDNLFFMGHAYGVFKPIYEAYHHQDKLTLKVGDIAYYTDGVGELYAYKEISVSNPTLKDFGKGSSWAATPTPVITLDTCDNEKGGKNNYRIIIRFVPTQIPSVLPAEIQSQID